jgi:hypothetical protein
MRVSVDSLRAGMTLSAELRESGGRLLLPAATELTDRHLRYLQMWGVAEVEVDGGPGAVEPDSGLTPELLAHAEAELAPRFRHVDLTHPAAAFVFGHCAARLAQARLEGSTGGE